jgi:hypothetical protein
MKDYQNIDGWFNYEAIFNFLLDTCSPNGTFVECGAWLGKSSAYLADVAAQKNVNVTIVDSWLGSVNERDSSHKLAVETDIYKIFLDNMGDRKFNHIRALSSEASLQFENESCDVVFIDMEHTYTAVTKDIDLWLPKVKVGGYLSGHDYSADWHDVVRAVDEKLGKENIKTDMCCWIYKKQSL